MSADWQCPAMDAGLRCEKQREHGGRHRAGKGALARTWGGKMTLGAKTAIGRAAAGRSGPAARKERCCRICLEGETVTEGPPGRLVSSLRDGICADRQACESRCAPLFGPQDFTR